jgi:hypothetical protein
MSRYKVGNAITDVWYGASFGRSFQPFEAGSDPEAWEEGQRLWRLMRGPDSGEILVLERQYHFPGPKLLNGPDVTAHSLRDKDPQGWEVWVRVAVGIHETPWSISSSEEGPAS